MAASNLAKRDDASLNWLVLGATLGLLAAGWALLQGRNASQRLPDNAVARVNDQFIERELLERSLQRQQSDSRDTLDEADRAWVLQRLVEEELLVQRGLELGMAQSENEVRGAIVRSLIASVTAEADAANPDEAELRRWFEENPERFSYASALAVEAWVSDEQTAANEFAAALRKGATETKADGIRPLPGLPVGLLPPAKLRDYLGPGITKALESSPAGMVAVYVRMGRWLIVRLDEKQQSTVADFDSVSTQVLMEYRRALADRRLRDYLDTLRERADVVIAAQ